MTGSAKKPDENPYRKHKTPVRAVCRHRVHLIHKSTGLCMPCQLKRERAK